MMNKSEKDKQQKGSFDFILPINQNFKSHSTKLESMKSECFVYHLLYNKIYHKEHLVTDLLILSYYPSRKAKQFLMSIYEDKEEIHTWSRFFYSPEVLEEYLFRVKMYMQRFEDFDHISCCSQVIKLDNDRYELKLSLDVS
jgi:hypothetical protein